MCRDCATAPTDQISRRGFLVRAGLVVGTPTLLGLLENPLHLQPLAKAAGAKQIEVICKAAWGGAPADGRFSRHTVKRLTVHHSGTELRDNRDAPAQLRSIQRYHQSQGWPDIAYHFVVDRNGNIYKGRPTWSRPDTFTGYETRGHLTVMCLGNFDEQAIPSAQVAATRDLLAWAAEKFEVPLRKIRGHRDYTSTACPGRALYRVIQNGDLRKAVRRRKESGGVTVKNLCGEEGRRRVGSIERGEA